MITSQVTIPASIDYLEPLIAYCESLTKKMGFELEDSQKICSSLEENVVFVIQHLFPEINSDTIEISFEQATTSISFIIHHLGEPIDPALLPVFTPGSPENIETIGLYIMKTYMDEVVFTNLGRKGKEWRLKKNLSTKRIDKLVDLDTIDKKMVPGDRVRGEHFSYEITDFTPDHALGVSKCAYYAYGYSYDDFIYYPEKIIALNNEGILRSIVAISDTGKIIGHGALRFEDKKDIIAELAAGFVNPHFRGHGVNKKIADYCFAKAEQLSLLGLYSKAVTSHTISQRSLYEKGGFDATGLLLGSFIPGIDFKDITGKTTQKESMALMFRPFIISPEKQVYLPEKHSQMIQTIYHNLGIPVRSGVAYSLYDEPNPSDEHDISSKWHNITNTVNIKVLRYGNHSYEELRSQLRFYCMEHVDAIFCFLNLEDPKTPSFSDACEELGFFFAGILPGGISGCDALILQYLNNVKIDPNRINLYSPFSKEILSYVLHSVG